MKMTFQQSTKNDAARIVGTYLSVKNEFFQHHQFLVLPFLKHKCVFLPDFNYSSLLKIKDSPTYHPREYKNKTLKPFIKELETYTYPSRIPITHIKKEFTQIKKKLDTQAKLSFPALFKKVNDIEITITPFGTDGSFDYKKVGNKCKIYLWIRNSGCTMEHLISHLVHCYISAFVLIATKIFDSNSVEWKSREAIVDFLMTYTFSSFHKTYTSTTLPFIESKQRSQNLIEKSDKYLTKLNAKLAPPVVKMRKDMYYVNDKKIGLISKKETALFTLLFENKNKFVTKEVILSTLYKGLEGSDWSVSKSIERLRKRIEKAGINFPLIQTSRSIGYKLICK